MECVAALKAFAVKSDDSDLGTCRKGVAHYCYLELSNSVENFDLEPTTLLLLPNNQIRAVTSTAPRKPAPRIARPAQRYFNQKAPMPHNFPIQTTMKSSSQEVDEENCPRTCLWELWVADEPSQNQKLKKKMGRYERGVEGCEHRSEGQSDRRGEGRKWEDGHGTGRSAAPSLVESEESSEEEEEEEGEVNISQNHLPRKTKALLRNT
ncbi:hypothetical protein FRC01_002098 [Tulasnella sp. 417]|nr:hypothetical protein FRC01_002098 [Tulasnella sp. 417]